MRLFARFVELCANFGANCASVCLTYQPKLPKSLM
ncbi:MAG: cyclic lactone autoinducer peptide [Lachnospiraceae bacterium]